MRMDTEQLGIPDDSFTSECTMPAAEFARICKEFGGIGDSSTIMCLFSSYRDNQGICQIFSSR
jgi:hypothetical protein